MLTVTLSSTSKRRRAPVSPVRIALRSVAAAVGFGAALLASIAPDGARGPVVALRSAAAIEDLISPRSLGVGNSLRADATGALGPQLNPAAMPFRRGYNIEVMYGLRFQDLGHVLNLSIVDSITTRVSAGVYYSYVHSNPKFASVPFGGTVPPQDVHSDATRSGHESGLSLAIPIGEIFSFGVTAKYITVSTTGPNPNFVNADKTPLEPELTTYDSSTGQASANGFTFDVGFALRLAQNRFNIGLVGYNLIPLRSVEAPMSLGIGLAVKPTPAITIALDSLIYFDRYRQALTQAWIDEMGTFETDRFVAARLGGGLEWLIAQKVPLRLGALWDSGRPGTYVSMGTGFMHPRFSIDLSHRQQVQGGVESLMVLGLRVFLE